MLQNKNERKLTKASFNDAHKSVNINAAMVGTNLFHLIGKAGRKVESITYNFKAAYLHIIKGY